MASMKVLEAVASVGPLMAAQKADEYIAELEKERDSALAGAREMERKFATEKESHRLTNSALIKYRTEAGTKGLLIQTLEKRLANTRKLAREAVGVMEQVQAHCKPADIFWDKLPLVDRKRVDTFLSKPEVKALKGGE